MRKRMRARSRRELQTRLLGALLAILAERAAFARAVRILLVREFRVVQDDAPEGDRDRRAVEALFAILDDLEAIPDREAPWPGAREGAEGFSALLSAQRLFVGERGGMRRPGAVLLGDAVVLRALAKDPAERYRNAEGIAATWPAREREPSVSRRSFRRRRRRSRRN